MSPQQEYEYFNMLNCNTLSHESNSPNNPVTYGPKAVPQIQSQSQSQTQSLNLNISQNLIEFIKHNKTIANSLSINESLQEFKPIYKPSCFLNNLLK